MLVEIQVSAIEVPEWECIVPGASVRGTRYEKYDLSGQV